MQCERALETFDAWWAEQRWGFALSNRIGIENGAGWNCAFPPRRSLDGHGGFNSPSATFPNLEISCIWEEATFISSWRSEH